MTSSSPQIGISTMAIPSSTTSTSMLDRSRARTRPAPLDLTPQEAAPSPYQLILDHVFTYPGTYDIPLRTMLTLNTRPQAQQLMRLEANSSIPSSPTAAHFEHSQITTPSFSTTLVNHISKLPTKPSSLPPSFITAFLRKAFTPELINVDFNQALTGIDYLKDLESRRRQEVAAAFGRLTLKQSTLAIGVQELGHKYPGLVSWVKGVEDSERKIESLYSTLFVTLRRWILINELHLTPFNKHNCFAMLNTLYPPVNGPTTQPTSKLTPEVVKIQRDGFFRYIQGVQTRGTSILEALMMQGKREGDANGWPAVHETLEKYLRVAISIIDDCRQVSDLAYFENKDDESTGGRKADSGVSFYSSDRPSSKGSTLSTAVKDRARLSDPVPGPHSQPNTPLPMTPTKGLSALERLAREFRKKASSSSRPAVERQATPEPERPKTADGSRRSLSLKRVRSLGNLRSRSRSRSRGCESREGAPQGSLDSFDPEEMRRQRQRYEAAQAQSPASFFED